MNNHYSDLSLFEYDRNNEYMFPLIGTNTFYSITNGRIGIYSKEDNKLSLSIENGNVLCSDLHINGNPYDSFIIKQNSALEVVGTLHLSMDTKIHGTLVLKKDSHLIIDYASVVTLYSDSTFIIEDGSRISVNTDSSLSIYGKIDVSLGSVNNILNANNIVIDTVAVVDVKNIDLGRREYSLTDYEKDLRNRKINHNTQSEHNSGLCKIGYTWANGNILQSSQVIDLSVLWGNSILGDFKLQVLGTQSNLIPNLQIIRNLYVEFGSTLNITTEFEESRYLHPELYLGRIIGNSEIPGECIVNGTINCSGSNSKITVDRGAKLIINENGTVIISDNSILQCTHIEEDETVLFINGTLIIDRLEQLIIPSPHNVQFGDKGKLVILNKYDEETLLFSTPLGIENSELYRIFRDNIEHIEYHVPNNCGIKIDKYYEFYGAQMTNWYANRRFEKAIKDKLLVWEDGFIILDKEIIPWVSTQCNLYHASKLFKNNNADDKLRLQEVAEHMLYCGSGNIRFRFVDGANQKEVTLNLDRPSLIVGTNLPESNAYRLLSTSDGFLFLRNNIGNADKSSLISNDSRMFIIGTDTSISLN